MLAAGAKPSIHAAAVHVHLPIMGVHYVQMHTLLAGARALRGRLLFFVRS